MNVGWRSLAVTIGTLMAAGGVALWATGAGPALLIMGLVVLVTVLVERGYGHLTRVPLGGNWRPTDEKFVDPESGELVTVWFDPASGERRYVGERQQRP